MSAPHRLIVLVALLVSALASGCVTLDKEEVIAPDAPVEFYRGARKLKGAPLASIANKAAKTRASGRMDVRAVEKVAASARPAVLSIYFKTKQAARVRLLPFSIPGLGIPVSLPGAGLGSGFIIHEDGYVLTNAHVIRGASDHWALSATGQELDLEVLAVDPVFDLALLKIIGTQGPFPVIPLGDSDKAPVGSWAVAVGNPLGLGHTVTLGIISQTGRHLSGVDPAEGREISFIQMDTAINPGSSGGPLISLTGACVGVNTAGYVEANGISFAVPTAQVKDFLYEVLQGEQPTP
ncbi:MAG: trypsin-like peptidase domain-containing protein [Planctomycetota bacterium]|nr:trypsin-like peptidase domain-containing protein [Planctomycetota bacterium]MDG1986224.1 trypsin-like peptidase domain-containing protein [Planctomycetota bacterium]